MSGQNQTSPLIKIESMATTIAEPVKKTRADGQISGLAGELFVAAELLKRGLQTSVTFGNPKSINRPSESETKEKMSLNTHQSVYRERMLEHLLIGDLLKHSWLHSNANLEVSQPSIDRSGHDVVLEANGVTRHIQLKASSLTATTSVQKIHVGLQKKPSGCVVWMRFDPENLALGPFLFFGGLPGDPLPSLDDFKVAKHTKGNAEGVKKDRPNLRLIPQSKFRQVATIDELYRVLFGTAPETVKA